MSVKKEQAMMARARLIDMSTRGRSGFVEPLVAMQHPDATLDSPSKLRPATLNRPSHPSKRPPVKRNVVTSSEPLTKRPRLRSKDASRGTAQSTAVAPQVQPPDAGSVRRHKVLEGSLETNMLTDVDGIDERAAQRLYAKGWSVDTLFGQWCLFKKNREGFIDFLAEEVALDPKAADCCYECLHEYFGSHVH